SKATWRPSTSSPSTATGPVVRWRCSRSTAPVPSGAGGANWPCSCPLHTDRSLPTFVESAERIAVSSTEVRTQRLETGTSLIPTLPGSYYTDPEIFEREKSRIFQRNWFAAARSTDLPEPGSFRAVDVGGESVLIVRGRDRKLR